MQDHFVVTRILELDAADAGEVHDVGTMDPRELFVAEVPLEIGQWPANDVRGGSDVHAGVVPRGLDPVDVVDVQENDLPPIPHDQPLSGPGLWRGSRNP